MGTRVLLETLSSITDTVSCLMRVMIQCTRLHLSLMLKDHGIPGSHCFQFRRLGLKLEHSPVVAFSRSLLSVSLSSQTRIKLETFQLTDNSDYTWLDSGTLKFSMEQAVILCPRGHP